MIPGYTYGTESVPTSPLTLADFELLKKTVLFTDEDIKYLRMSKEVLKDQLEALLDVWYSFIGSQPHLLYYFEKSDGKPDTKYLEVVRKRFHQWVLDTANANYDQKWLDYQFEIGRRHHHTAKNKTDQVNTPNNIAYRYMPALLYPISYTLKSFLGKKGHSLGDVEKMYQAWLKSLILQSSLWSYPYIKEGDF